MGLAWGFTKLPVDWLNLGRCRLHPPQQVHQNLHGYLGRRSVSNSKCGCIKPIRNLSRSPALPQGKLRFHSRVRNRPPARDLPRDVAAVDPAQALGCGFGVRADVMAPSRMVPARLVWPGKQKRIVFVRTTSPAIEPPPLTHCLKPVPPVARHRHVYQGRGPLIPPPGHRRAEVGPGPVPALASFSAMVLLITTSSPRLRMPPPLRCRGRE